MVKSLTTLGLALALIVAPGLSLAADHHEDSVSIDSISHDGCGKQSVTIEGSATYSEPTQHLVVTVGGVEVLYDTDEPLVWSVTTGMLSADKHTVEAKIYDKSGYRTVKASDSQEVDLSCGGSGGNSGGEGGQGGEGDCCPGPDENGSGDDDISEATGGQVAGSMTSSDLARLAPLNDTFRKVYGRGPTFAEWEYWANRYLNDKPQWDAIYGAMQYHQLHGRTIGG